MYDCKLIERRRSWKWRWGGRGIMCTTNLGSCVWDEISDISSLDLFCRVFYSFVLYERSSQRWKIWRNVDLSIVCAVRAVALSLTSHSLMRTLARRHVIILRLPLPSVPRFWRRHRAMIPIARTTVRVILRPIYFIRYRKYHTKQVFEYIYCGVIWRNCFGDGDYADAVPG